MTYTICFDFPETDPWFPARLKGGLGFTTSLGDALKYDTEDEAERLLKNGYGTEAQRYGSVVEVGS